MIRVLFAGLTTIGALAAAPAGVTFAQPAGKVEAYDFIEITATVAHPDAANPFMGATLTGSFGKAGARETTPVDGFCDAADGSVFRIRFMPSSAGNYTYSLTYKQGAYEKTQSGAFEAVASARRGPIRVDPAYPWSFIWEGTKQHYFFNGTTTFWLMGWRDERVIDSILDRYARLEVNRARVLLSGRAYTMYGEPVMNTADWTLWLSPWPAVDATDYLRPGFDYTRFRLEHWQRFDRMLRYAREKNIIISIILDINDGHVHMVAGSDDERRYIRYATARFGAFSNITWDLGDDLDAFRNDQWAHETGTLLESWDPNHHLATSHPIHGEHQDRGSAWFGFTSIQEWGRTQHALMLAGRQLQIKAGRIIPQTNEEYGYEDHYPRWAPPPPGDSADTLRRTAWDIAMAGAYGTSGETVKRGVGVWPDTGGGWFNGRGDDTMVMLNGYQHMVDFFTSFEWWKTDPHDELVDNGAYCLARPGQIYVVYLSHGGDVTVNLQPGEYAGKWLDAFTGDSIPVEGVQGGAWKTRAPGRTEWPGDADWALLLQRVR